MWVFSVIKQISAAIMIIFVIITIVCAKEKNTKTAVTVTMGAISGFLFMIAMGCAVADWYIVNKDRKLINEPYYNDIGDSDKVPNPPSNLNICYESYQYDYIDQMPNDLNNNCVFCDNKTNFEWKSKPNSEDAPIIINTRVKKDGYKYSDNYCHVDCLIKTSKKKYEKQPLYYWSK
jgi:hypothetical protein